MKIVRKLNKKKYRSDLWMDAEGGVWFFDYDTNDWRVLVLVSVFDGIVGAEGYANDPTEDCKGWPDGPFKRVLKGSKVAKEYGL